MPNHIHLILYFNKENYLSAYMRDFKKYTSYKTRMMIIEDGATKLVNALRYENRNQKFKIWMDRFDDVYLESPYILETKLDYIHYNPVEKNLCVDPLDYPYSSAYFYFQESQNGFPVEVSHYKEYF